MLNADVHENYTNHQVRSELSFSRLLVACTGSCFLDFRRKISFATSFGVLKKVCVKPLVCGTHGFGINDYDSFLGACSRVVHQLLPAKLCGRDITKL